jgi:hypothetical protein
MQLKNANLMQRVGLFVWLVLAVAIVMLHGPWNGYWIVDERIYDIGSISSDDFWFWSWSSKGLVSNWFARVSNALMALAAVTVVLGAWLYLFDSARGPEKSDETPAA